MCYIHGNEREQSSDGIEDIDSTMVCSQCTWFGRSYKNNITKQDFNILKYLQNCTLKYLQVFTRPLCVQTCRNAHFWIYADI